MSDKIAWRLLFIWIAASGILIIIQYAFDRRIDTSVLTYLIPGCTASYLFGRHDGFRECVSKKAENEQTTAGMPPKGE